MISPFYINSFSYASVHQFIYTISPTFINTRFYEKKETQGIRY